jgi:predicted P-loop ATPase
LEELQNDIKVEKLDASPIKINESLERSRFKQWIMAQAPAVQGENGNDYTYNTAAYGFDFGLSKEDILEVMLEWDQKNSPSWGEQELSTIIGNAAKYAQNAKGKAAINFEVFTSNKPLAESVYKPGVYDDAFYAKLHPGTALTYRGDHILPTASNLRIVLLADRYKGLFLWDTFRKKIALSNRPLWRGNKADGSLTMSDMDWRELRVDLSITAKMDCPTLLLEDAVYSLAIARSFNPICDWLNGLQWDGKPRIGMLFGYGYYRLTVAQIFLLASIYRIFYPGYKFDHMLVIAGAQGLGKSYLIEAIGGEFAKVAKKIPTDSRSVQEIEGAWWLEFPELTSVNKVDINQIKAFITCTKDTYIPMYGKHGPQDFPRVCIPVWTINPTVAGFITDDENRRFLIIDQTEKIPVDYIKANRDQIFAEAMELYRNGVRPHKLVETIKDHAEEKAQINKDSDVWEDLISDWLIKGNKENATVTTREVYFDALSIYSVESWDKRSQQRIAKCLRQLGWVKKKSSGATFFVKNDEEDIDIEEDV